MNGLPYYKAYPRDFIEGTIKLPFEVKAAYRLVLDLIYMQGGNLPDDARYISGLLGLSVRKWNGLRAQLLEAGKLVVVGEFLTNYRAVKELETLRSFQDKQAQNRSRPNKNKEIETPRSHHTEPDTEPEEKERIPLRGPAAVSVEKSVEAEVYAVGKKVLGKKAGGVITNLRKMCEYDDEYALEWLRKAAEKQDAMEWLQAVLKASANREYLGVINLPQPTVPVIETKERREYRRWEADYYRAVL
jgi:uncharacterized protein YdaU (DUF1376 family)